MLNRQQRRSFQKKGISPDAVELTTEIVQMGVEMAAAGFGDILPEATVVEINPETYERGNTKRERWIEDHLGQQLTVEYDPKWGDEPRIYCLAEDDSDPKWYFVRNEFIVISRPTKKEEREEEQEEVREEAQEEKTNVEEDRDTEEGAGIEEDIPDNG